jgi:8-oxo-dGTP diphosphatase
VTTNETPRLLVTAAVIERDGRFLVTRRPQGKHLEGYWEFPGGKCNDGEALDDCLRREIVEELDASVTVHGEIYRVTHPYPDRIVELRFFRCTLVGEARPTMGQEMQWVSRAGLGNLKFPPADAELIEMLRGNLRNETSSA